MSNKEKNKSSVFGEAMGKLAGIDSLFASTPFSMIPLDMVTVREQIRVEFDEDGLAELADSIRKRGILQPILLRNLPDGYELVAGERRYRAARLVGLDAVPAYIRDMSDEEAEDAQLAENIQRQNLTQMEEAKKLKRDLDMLGSREAVCQKHHKSPGWLSKRLALLDLPTQTQRLIAEDLSADVEVINNVKQVEKADPVAAKALVEELKENRGKVDARNKTAAVKDAVKPPKKTADATKKPVDAAKSKSGSGIMATPKDRTHEEPSAVTVTASVTEGGSNPLQPVILSKLWDAVANGKPVDIAIEELSQDKKLEVSDWLRTFYDTGKKTVGISTVVFAGVASGQFGTAGASGFALAAFLQGADGSQKRFDLRDILGCAKKVG